MTREEASNQINDIKTELAEHLLKKDIEALDMAISALKGYDGMTNGEVIQALFSDSYFLNAFPFEVSSIEKIYIDNNKDNKTHIMVQEDWWNAPYKGESEGKADE